MAFEFDSSSKNELSHLFADEHNVLQAFAEDTDDLELLGRLRDAAVDLAMANEYNIEANDTAVFIDQKIKSIEESKLRQAKAQVQKWTDQDQVKAEQFYAIISYLKLDNPQGDDTSFEDK